MTKYIDKSAVVAEIERRISQLENKYKELSNFEVWITAKEIKCKINGLKEALSIVNTLEVKVVDFEEKATQLSQKYFPDEENIWARANIEAQRCKSACIEMVEWFKAQK